MTTEPPPDAAEWPAVHGLLLNAADIVEEAADTTLSTAFLQDGAVCECAVWDLEGEQTTQWVAGQAAYQIACTLGIPPRDRDDPLIAAVIETLSQHTPSVQARVVRAAATRTPSPTQMRPTYW